MSAENKVFNPLQSNHPIEFQSVASAILETKRVPDPYIFHVNSFGQLTLPTGEVVEQNIDTDSTIGQLEMRAFKVIQSWAGDTKSGGKMLWFSPPYQGIYPESKVIISEKIPTGIINRAIILDIPTSSLLKLANSNRKGINYPDSRALRSVPLLLDDTDFYFWFKELEKVTDQTELIVSGQDLRIKADTLVQIEDLAKTIPIYSKGKSSFESIMLLARQRGLRGNYSESCPVLLKTAFSEMFDHSLVIGEGKYVKNCGNCGRKIEMKIKKGYKCQCGGVYEGC